MRLTNIVPDSELDIVANELLVAAQRYWQAFNAQAVHSPDARQVAVVWVRDTGGQVVVMTRGEYADDLQSFVDGLG